MEHVRREHRIEARVLEPQPIEVRLLASDVREPRIPHPCLELRHHLGGVVGGDQLAHDRGDRGRHQARPGSDLQGRERQASVRGLRSNSMALYRRAMRHLRPCAPATLLLLLGGCVVEEDPPSLDQTEQANILGTEDWNQLPTFETDATYFRGALYGRATAHLDMGVNSDGETGLCSGWLITDNILVTANHCRTGNASITARFGMYDSQPGLFTNGTADARQRQGELGLQGISPAILTDALLTTFSCSLYETEPSRDVDYYICSSNKVTITMQPFGRSRTFELFPGHLWGQYEVELGGRANDDAVYSVSVNRTNAQVDAGQSRTVLLSPNGWVSDAAYDHVFKYLGADSLCGSSGGVIVDQSNHRAFAVVSAEVGEADSCTRTIHSNSNSYANVGEELGDVAGTLLGYGVSSDPLPKVGTHNTAYVGGTGGVARTTSCPPNFVAVGVIGTRTSNVVGNFGLICSPYRRGYNEATGADATLSRDLKNSTVIAGGSIDTSFAVASNADYNAYWHDVVPNSSATSPQAQLMCPFGSYLSGATVSRVNALISGIDSIRCTELKKVGSAVQSRFTLSASAGLSGQTSTKQSALCTTNSYVTGIFERSGHFTDGFRFSCTQLFPVLAVPPNPN